MPIDPSSCPLGGVCDCCVVNLTKATGSPVGVLVDLWRAGSNPSLVRPERVAGSDGLSIHLNCNQKTQVRLSVERDPLFITQAHATSSLGSGLNTQTVTEYDIMTVNMLSTNY